MPCWAGRDRKPTTSGLRNPESHRAFQTGDGPTSHSAPCGYSARHQRSAAAGQAGKNDAYGTPGGPGQRHSADVLRAVIAANDLGFATPFGDPVEEPADWRITTWRIRKCITAG